LDLGRFDDLVLCKGRRRSEACFLGFTLIKAPLPAACDEEAMMDVIHDRVAGLDVHKDTVVACVRTTSGNKATRECRTFATTTEGLLALLAWLDGDRCVVAAMEATGAYWLPIWKILSAGEFELILANATLERFVRETVSTASACFALTPITAITD
jgi:hypothetical protein